MATTKQQDVLEVKAEAKSGGRSASYPAIDLSTAVKRVEEFWKHDTKYETSLANAYGYWGYSPKSSGARLTIAAMLNYGLMADRGSNESRMVRLTPLAIDLMMAPNDEMKKERIKQAAKNPRVFSDLLRQWDPKNLPSDSTIAHYLVTQKGFNPNGTETCIKNFRAAINFAGLDQDVDEKEASTSSTSTPDSTSSTDAPPVDGKVSGEPANAEKKTVVARSPAGVNQDVYTLGDEGQVVLQWPEKMSQESYDELVDWIELQLRKIARLNKVERKH